MLPIYLTEILFPAQRDRPWLDRRGLNVAAVIFVLSSIGVWQLWSHVGVQKYGPSTYRVPLVYIGIALILIVELVLATVLRRPSVPPGTKSTRRAWAPWLVGFLAFGHWLAWFVLIILGYLPATMLPGVSPLLPIGIGLDWAGVAVRPLFINGPRLAKPATAGADLRGKSRQYGGWHCRRAGRVAHRPDWQTHF